MFGRKAVEKSRKDSRKSNVKLKARITKNNMLQLGRYKSVCNKLLKEGQGKCRRQHLKKVGSKTYLGS